MIDQRWVDSILTQCASLGVRTVPVFDGGTTKKFADGQDYKDMGDYVNAVHIGVVLDGLVLLDYDGNKVSDIMSESDLSEVLELPFGMPDAIQHRERSIHWLFRKAGKTRSSSNDGWRKGIDIKTGNQLMHLKQGKVLDLSLSIEEAPDAIIAALGGYADSTFEAFDDDDIDALDSLIGDSTMSVDRVRDLIATLDHNMPNGQWVKVGQALHNWHHVEGLALWEEWSKGGNTYQEGECAKRWKSFDVGGGVTMGTVVHMAKVADYDAHEREILKMLDTVKHCDQRTLEVSIVDEIKAMGYNAITKERFVKAIAARWQELVGVKVPVATIRKSLDDQRSRITGVAGAPTWCKDWIYIDRESCFWHVPSRDTKSNATFNMICGKFIPENESGGKPTATKFVADNGFIDVVSGVTYLPSCEDMICDVGGVRLINRFDAQGLPVAATSYTAEGKRYIELVQTHIKQICNNQDEYANILMQWVAWQVQFKGRKLLWSPVIQSIEGVGKTWFHKLLGSMIGMDNVKTVSPAEVTNSFNGWATNSCVNILNEIYISGHNRYEAVNAIKPLITDSAIMINDKGVKQYQAINVTNYICFTNYKNAVPMGADSRRWWVIFVEMADLESVGDCVGMSKDDYFDAIFDAIDLHGDELLKFFSEYPITDTFKALKQAPTTIYKNAIVATERASGIDGLEEADALIRNPRSNAYGSDFVSSYHFFRDLEFDLLESGVTLKGRAKSALLSKLGFTRAPEFTKRDGEHKTTLWVKRESDAEKYAVLLASVIKDGVFPF